MSVGTQERLRVAVIQSVAGVSFAAASQACADAPLLTAGPVQVGSEPGSAAQWAGSPTQCPTTGRKAPDRNQRLDVR